MKTKLNWIIFVKIIFCNDKITKYLCSSVLMFDRVFYCVGFFPPQRSGTSRLRGFHTDSRSHTCVSRWNLPLCHKGKSRQQQAGSRRKLPHVARHNHAQVRPFVSSVWQQRDFICFWKRFKYLYPPLSDQQQYASNEQSKLPDPSRIRLRVPPNMPKLFIPSTVTKFPPEITVTPPTPTLLSPKGSISEETKQRLKVRSLPLSE